MTEFPDFYNHLGECNGDTILSKKNFFMMVDTNPDDVKDSQTRLEMVRYEASTSMAFQRMSSRAGSVI